MRTFGMEEEFFIVSPLTGLPCAPPAAARAALLALTVGGTTTVGEFLACQVESNSPICTDRAEALDTVRSYRAALSRAATDLGFQVVALGTPPRIPNAPAVVTPTDRYRAITSLCEGIATEHYVSGLHVHVCIEDPESGIIALNELRRWLPVLTACGSNSPYWRGNDSGFASWRNIHYRRWSVQGIPPHFAGLQDYERRMQYMLDSDVVLDPGHISWGARLSTHYPTVEVRVADTQMNASNTVLLALIARALVDTSINGAPPGLPPLAEALDLAQWQAAKFGLHGNHLDPLDGTRTSAAGMLRSLMGYIQHALKQNGDSDYVAAGLARLLEHGTGAGIQRDRFHRGGFNAVLDEAAAAIAN
ncbi:carboxylate-amine ligase [Paeniglutamicibacter kerguelensis]|uniref:Putative glutamate--cysteine ligase 2 n=1 Tax=Paeniglutamicibacter kerguelensis TaxID=254788 RepID=A0ABS4XJQ8_9MICC|nr:glutamate--cysteine ligase [Paeniglutamicibacter kerguelensis]MBP2388682.1 carboxylate-amine ligase [Paeniglutamicibacter kerguelensis]